MTASLLEIAQDRWSVWQPDARSSSLTAAVVARSAAMPRRGVVFLGPRGSNTFSVLLKVGLEDRSNTQLELEFERMVEVSNGLRVLDAPLFVPDALDLLTWRNRTVLVQELRPGQFCEVPVLARSGTRAAARAADRFLGRVDEVSGWIGRITDLSEVSTRDLVADLQTVGQPFLSGGGVEIIDLLPDTISLTWQHGDAAPGNVLVHRGSISLIDWELASPDLPWFFDITYAYLSLFTLGSPSQDSMRQALRGSLVGGSPYRLDWWGSIERRAGRYGASDWVREPIRALLVTALIAALRSKSLGRAVESPWWTVADELIRLFTKRGRGKSMRAARAANDALRARTRDA